MKVLSCPQCGGTVYLTQYPGVYHCRYCRTLVYEETIQKLELKKQELDLSKQILAETQAANLKRAERVRNWHKLCSVYWGFILITFFLGMAGAFFSFPASIGEYLTYCILLRVPVSPVIAALRPDASYSADAPPICSKVVLVGIFWIFDMVLWCFLLMMLV